MNNKKSTIDTQVKTLHLLFLTDILDGMGGAERNLVLLAQHFRMRGTRVTVLCLKGGVVSDSLKQEGFSVHVFNQGKIFSLEGLLRIRKIRSLVRRENVSAVMTYHLSSDIIGACIGATTRVPVISSRRDLGFQLTAKHHLFYRLFNRQYTAITVVSAAVKDVVVKAQDVDPSRVTVIHNGVDLESFSSSEEDMKNTAPNDNKVNICCLANIRPIKGHNFLLEAIGLLKEIYPDFCFYCIGSFDEEDTYYQALKKKIHELDIENHVKFTGGVPGEQVFGLLRTMDISVLASLSEGMPNTLLESMAAGLPVVATAVGGNVEVVKHGETGYLVPAEDAGKLAEMLLFLLKNPVKRQKMAQKARQRFEKNFSVKIMTSRYEDIIRYVLIKKQKYALYHKWARNNFCTSLKQHWKNSLATILYYLKIIWLFRLLKGWIGKNRVSILCLHDVVGAESKWLRFYVATLSDHFSRIIDTIHESSQVVSLEQACGLLEKSKKSEKELVAITFDDCYSSFNGKIFDKCCEKDIPYAIFLNTYPLDKKKFLLHDALIYVATTTWRKVVHLPQISDEVFLLDNENAYRHFVDVVLNTLQSKPFTTWNNAINDLAAYLEVDLHDERLSNHFLSWDDVRQLHESGVTIGAHTVHHPLLTSLPDEACYYEMGESKQRLEEELQTPVCFFSYPYGHRDSFNKKVTKQVKKCGFQYAFTLVDGEKFSSPFTISRKNVSPGLFLSGNGTFSRALFELELCGLGDVVFGRWLRKFRA